MLNWLTNLKEIDLVEFEKIWQRLNFVSNETKKILAEADLWSGIESFTFSYSVCNQIINTKNWVNDLVDYIQELFCIAEDVAEEIIDINKKVNSEEGLEKTPFKIETNYFYNLRHFIQNLAYNQLKKVYWEDFERRQLYIYYDIPIYIKLSETLKIFNSEELSTIKSYTSLSYLYDPTQEKIDVVKYFEQSDKFEVIQALVQEFIEYFQWNKEFFEKRYNFDNCLSLYSNYLK